MEKIRNDGVQIKIFFQQIVSSIDIGSRKGIITELRNVSICSRQIGQLIAALFFIPPHVIAAIFIKNLTFR